MMNRGLQSTFLKPLLIGKQAFATAIIQGPLAGISCAPFRGLVEKYSAPAFTYTEMISCNSLLYQPDLIYKRYLKKLPGEKKLAVQLAGNNPLDLAEAVKHLTEYGADLIDLNCGCPVKKIRSKELGSKLLTSPQKIFELITAMKKNTHLPISIKIRIPEKNNNAFNHEIGKAVEEAGADCIVVHGRHWTEHYETPCHYDAIQFFVETLKIPVIGNGDIACVASLRKMLATGCHGVMVSRATVGQPWLIGKLIAGLDQQPFSVPNTHETGLIWFEHVRQLALLLNNDYQAILQARKFAKYYARHIADKIGFYEKIKVCNNLQNLEKIRETYFN